VTTQLAEFLLTLREEILTAHVGELVERGDLIEKLSKLGLSDRHQLAHLGTRSGPRSKDGGEDAIAFKPKRSFQSAKKLTRLLGVELTPVVPFRWGLDLEDDPAFSCGRPAELAPEGIMQRLITEGNLIAE
jgi:hypothetical protein